MEFEKLQKIVAEVLNVEPEAVSYTHLDVYKRQGADEEKTPLWKISALRISAWTMC